jgi:hypothetical protein
MATFAITLKNDALVQTFTFSGETTLDQAFAEMEQRNRRERSFGEVADELGLGERAKVYSLIVNRDESQERVRPLASMSFDEQPAHQ